MSSKSTGPNTKASTMCGKFARTSPTPFRGQYRVYIIDEVHMFSNSAFNALLKTLEEPPSHGCSAFATTEIHKIPATILHDASTTISGASPRGRKSSRPRHVADQMDW